MNRALELGPRLAPILFRALNLDFRQSNTASALARGAQLLALSPAYGGVIISTYERMGLLPQDIITLGLPDTPEAFASYFDEILRDRDPAAAAIVWAALTERGYVADQLCASYVDLLLSLQCDRRALDVWLGYLSDNSEGYREATYVYNGGFKRKFSGVAFDWNDFKVPGVTASRERAAPGGEEWTLRLEFAGDRNLRFSHFQQFVYLEAGKYVLSARARAENVTTDQGVYLAVREARPPRRVLGRTPQLRGTQDWHFSESKFTVSEPETLLRVVVCRDESFRIESKIGGIVWLDDVTLRRR